MKRSLNNGCDYSYSYGHRSNDQLLHLNQRSAKLNQNSVFNCRSVHKVKAKTTGVITCVDPLGQNLSEKSSREIINLTRSSFGEEITYDMTRRARQLLTEESIREQERLSSLIEICFGYIRRANPETVTSLIQDASKRLLRLVAGLKAGRFAFEKFCKVIFSDAGRMRSKFCGL